MIQRGCISPAPTSLTDIHKRYTMKKIELRGGGHALVDDADFDFLNKYAWRLQKDAYNEYAITKDGLLMHRLILGLGKPELFCDHMDRNGLINQRANLRRCTNSQNQWNKRSARGSTSRFLGVNWEKANRKKHQRGMWVSKITTNGKVKDLGRFRHEIEAAIIYNIAARKKHGRFANPNRFSEEDKKNYFSNFSEADFKRTLKFRYGYLKPKNKFW